MDPHRFDAITKALGQARSRRSMLTMLSAAALGTVGLAGTERSAGAARGGNSACAAFCAQVFGDTRAAGQCTRDAAHGSGLCYTCGPASPGGTQPICCPQNPDGTCASYQSATCCGTSATCQHGTCVPQVCAHPDRDACTAQPSCGPANSCYCLQSVDGGVYCTSVASCAACAHDSDCFAKFGSERPICVANSCSACAAGTVCAAATCAAG